LVEGFVPRLAQLARAPDCRLETHGCRQPSGGPRFKSGSADQFSSTSSQQSGYTPPPFPSETQYGYSSWLAVVCDCISVIECKKQTRRLKGYRFANDAGCSHNHLLLQTTMSSEPFPISEMSSITPDSALKRYGGERVRA
jgi:hypothetical protein